MKSEEIEKGMTAGENKMNELGMGRDENGGMDLWWKKDGARDGQMVMNQLRKLASLIGNGLVSALGVPYPRLNKRETCG